MQTIDLLLKKEEITDEVMKDQVAIVFDILLATSTIASMFHHGAKEVIPVLDGEEALRKGKEQTTDDYILVGEYLGNTLEGFHSPLPSLLKDKVKGKRVIFSTTNGTVALKNSWAAEAVYAASILNKKKLANYLLTEHGQKNYMLVCSGSSNLFNLEDMYGAGLFIDTLLRMGAEHRMQWDLSDAALTALHFYKGNEDKGAELLKQSRVGYRLVENGLASEVDYIMNKNACPVIPKLHGDVLSLVNG